MTLRSLAPPMDHDRYQPGDTVGDWEIVRFVAAGGMGDVYEVRGTFGGKRGALKQIRSKFQRRSDVVERFATEARILASLEHPFIVGLLHAGKAERGPYMVMEWLDGLTLREVMNVKRVPFPLEEALAYAISICDALVATHKVGILHRDLKPENVYMLKRGGLKVVDFGLGKFTDSARGVLSAAGLPMLTPHYAAPEQIEQKAVDNRTDVYALGLLFIEMITGRYPYCEESGQIPAGEIAMARQLFEQPNSIRGLVPGALADLVDAAVDKDREKRPTSTVFLAGLRALRKAARRPDTFSEAQADTGPVVGGELLRRLPVGRESSAIVARPLTGLETAPVSPDAVADPTAAANPLQRVKTGRLQLVQSGVQTIPVAQATVPLAVDIRRPGAFAVPRPEEIRAALEAARQRSASAVPDVRPTTGAPGAQRRRGAVIAILAMVVVVAIMIVAKFAFAGVIVHPAAPPTLAAPMERS